MNLAQLRKHTFNFFALNELTWYDIILFTTFIFVAWGIAGIFFLSLPKPAAWYITAICVLISGRVAQKFLRRTPLLLTAMALFAFTMALLLLYWHGDPEMQSGNAVSLRSENVVIGLYTSFLTVYIGALLMLDAANGNAVTVEKLTESIVPWLAVALAVILSYAWPSLSVLMTVLQISKEQYALLMDVVLGAVGFAFIVLGVNRCCGGNASLAIAVVVVGYQLIGFADCIQYIRDPNLKEGSSVSILSVYAYFFSVAKLIYTLLFSWLIARHGMRQKDQDPGGGLQGIMMFIMMFFGLK